MSARRGSSGQGQPCRDARGAPALPRRACCSCPSTPAAASPPCRLQHLLPIPPLPADSAPGAPSKPALASGRDALTVQFPCPTGPIPVLHYVYRLERLDVDPAVAVYTTATSPHATATDNKGTCSFAVAAADIPDAQAAHRMGRFRVQLVRVRGGRGSACSCVHAQPRAQARRALWLADGTAEGHRC